MSEPMLEVNIPESVSNLSLPLPELVMEYKNLENRVLWLDGEIAEYSLEYIKYIINWNQEDNENDILPKDREPIKLMIFSGGGDLGVTNAIIDIIKLSKTPIYAYNMNTCFSGAAYIFMACHKRFCLEKSTFLIHSGSADQISGTHEQIEAFMQEYKRQIKELYDFVLNNTNIPLSLLKKNKGKEWTLTAKEAIELGVADIIITDIEQLLN